MIAAYILRWPHPDNDDYIETCRLVDAPELQPGQRVRLAEDRFGATWLVHAKVTEAIDIVKTMPHRVWTVTDIIDAAEAVS